MGVAKFIIDSSIPLPENAFIRHKLDLVDEWDFEKNDELGISIFSVSKGSARVVWWICPKCKSSYERRIDQQNISMKKRCVYCTGYKINHTNSLYTVHPELAKQWHPTKNGELTPNQVGYKSANKVWWMCEEGHEWKTIISSRHRGTGCPYCSGRNTIKGVTDIWTTNPELASKLANPEDGYKYTQSSNMKVNWKCPECHNTIKNKGISNVNNQGLSCNLCKGGKSYPERYMNSFLKQLDIDFENEKGFTWSNNRRYDFYIPSLSIIIEMHGIQHYVRSFQSKKKTYSLEETQENDKYKMKLAIEHNIENYIVIDSRFSDCDYISENIKKSALSTLIDLSIIDWEICKKEATKSIVREVCRIYNETDCSVKELSDTMKLDVTTIYDYIKIGTKNGWCDFQPRQRIKK